jgi:NADH-quinone oxidoreductase subunit H
MQSVWVDLGNWIAALFHLPSRTGPTLGLFLGAFIILNLIMLVVTYMIWWLRKLVGWMQSRLGPTHVGKWGLLQTPADAIKLMAKEGIIPTLADKTLFVLAPAVVFIAAYLVYVTIPFAPNVYVADLNVGVVYVAAISSITVLGIILGAWASNNKYALLSAFRSAAQIVSYEVPFALAILGPVMLVGSFSFREIVQGAPVAGVPGMFVHGQSTNELLGSMGLARFPASFLDWFLITQPVVFLCFFIAGLAENNITPFDIVEAESEIVAGFHVEYSGMKFALLFLAEFANTMTLAVLTTLAFLGGWNFLIADGWFVRLLGGPGSVGATLWHLLWFGLKVGLLITVVFWLRATLPRVRVDQLMDLGWKLLIPVTLLNLLVTGGWVLLGGARWSLALTNWLLLIGVMAYGARKPLPKTEPIPAVEPATVGGTSG